MNKAKHRNLRRELLSRYGRGVSWHASISVRADRPRGLPPWRETHSSIQLEGEFTEAVAGVASFLIQVSPKENQIWARLPFRTSAYSYLSSRSYKGWLT